ncbi:hypothetical protein [Streptomyces sp. NPDC096068]|uniref:hypothetical protein n=1 Tax=Streptomyces sp. NPDC096068 TaxID=3155424 RepID=UPI0033328B95
MSDSEEGATPYTARYWRYGQQGEEEFDTLDEAVAYLASGWERADLAEIDILGLGGVVALEGGELYRRMMERLA